MFNLDDTLYEIMKKHPEALDFFIANGFEQLKNKQLLNLMGKNITLKTALMTKKINQELFIEKLETLYPSIQYVNHLMVHSWGQKVIRFYDLDGNLIEVGTPM